MFRYVARPTTRYHALKRSLTFLHCLLLLGLSPVWSATLPLSGFPNWLCIAQTYIKFVSGQPRSSFVLIYKYAPELWSDRNHVNGPLQCQVTRLVLITRAPKLLVETISQSLEAKRRVEKILSLLHWRKPMDLSQSVAKASCEAQEDERSVANDDADGGDNDDDSDGDDDDDGHPASPEEGEVNRGYYI